MPKKIVLSFWSDKTTLAKIEKLMKSEKRSRSNMIERLVEKGLANGK